MHDCKDLKIPDNNTPGSEFKVYGSGCERTAKFGENIIEAQKILGIDEGVEYTIDIFKIFEKSGLSIVLSSTPTKPVKTSVPPFPLKD